MYIQKKKAYAQGFKKKPPKKKPQIEIVENDMHRLIEMAWQDRTPFDAIETLYGFNENEVKKILRQLLLPKSYKRWRKRVQARCTKHQHKRLKSVTRFQGPW
jgi:uncharacterized protein (TIGR03643 family)